MTLNEILRFVVTLQNRFKWFCFHPLRPEYLNELIYRSVLSLRERSIWTGIRVSPKDLKWFTGNALHQFKSNA